MTNNDTTTTTTTTAQIIARLSVGDGATINAITGDAIASGYAVATDIQLRVPEACRASFLPAIEQFVSSARAMFPVLGSWRARGFREFAVSNVFDDLDTALYIARRNGEEAIFDLAKCVEIPVR